MAITERAAFIRFEGNKGYDVLLYKRNKNGPIGPFLLRL
jgi:hypothetical protein